MAAVPARARLLWSGRPPAPPLAAALAAAGADLVSRTGAELEVVVSGAGAAVPRPAGAGAWVWLAPRVPPAPAIAEAVTAGAYDVVAASEPPAALAARLVARVAELRLPTSAPPGAPHFVAESPAARRLLAELAQAARTSMPVLLTGETGTGKEISARLLHDWSSRRARRFVPINCAAIPNDLIESELFGHARGAFSGAVREYDGQLIAAEGGSVFLDEVDDTPLSFQLKLLRVLEDRTISRLGENRWRKVDFRILAATNRDLRPLIVRGLFGADLFERLAIVAIRLPPLRERLEDLPALLGHMIARFYAEEPAARERHAVTEVTPAALALLAAYRWPGNIRELRNVVFGALVHKRGGTALVASDLLGPLLRRNDALGDAPPVAQPDVAGARTLDAQAVEAAIAAGSFNLRAAVEALERAAVSAAVTRTAGNASAAAALLGEVGRGAARDPGATVRAMMRRLGLDGPRRRRR
jgi:DNA-binding NtrC family response regulator